MGFLPRSQRSLPGRNPNATDAYSKYVQSSNRGFDWKVPVIGLGAPIAAGYGVAALGSLGGGSAAGAASVPGAVGSSAAPLGVGTVTNGAGMWSLGSMLKSPAFGLGVNAFTSLMGNRAASQQQQRALDAQMRANAEATQLARDQMAEQQRQWNLSQADSRAALEAQNELKRRELAATEEERAFNRKLIEDREARLAPYRANAQRWAMTLAQMLRGR